ncbi:MAG: carboxypeptidase-like regulatory domain-containing protein [Chitinophagales bacterium]
MKTYYFPLFLFLQYCLFTNLYAQTGEIQGKVTDAETGETLPFVNVSIDINGSLINTTTDFDGVYSLNSIPYGTYTITFGYLCYERISIENIEVSQSLAKEIDIQLSLNKIIEGCESITNCRFWNPRLMSSDEGRSGITIIQNSRGHFDYFNIR